MSLLAGTCPLTARARWGTGGGDQYPLCLCHLQSSSFPRCCSFQQTGKALGFKQVPYSVHLPVSSLEPVPAFKRPVASPSISTNCSDMHCQSSHVPLLEYDFICMMTVVQGR